MGASEVAFNWTPITPTIWIKFSSEWTAQIYCGKINIRCWSREEISSVNPKAEDSNKNKPTSIIDCLIKSTFLLDFLFIVHPEIQLAEYLVTPLFSVCVWPSPLLNVALNEETV